MGHMHASPHRKTYGVGRYWIDKKPVVLYGREISQDECQTKLNYDIGLEFRNGPSLGSSHLIIGTHERIEKS